MLDGVVPDCKVLSVLLALHRLAVLTSCYRMTSEDCAKEPPDGIHYDRRHNNMHCKLESFLWEQSLILQQNRKLGERERQVVHYNHDEELVSISAAHLAITSSGALHLSDSSQHSPC